MTCDDPILLSLCAVPGRVNALWLKLKLKLEEEYGNDGRMFLE